MNDTPAWRRLGADVIIIGAALNIMFILVMYKTVTHAVWASMGVLSWTVLAACEGVLLLLLRLNAKMQDQHRDMPALRLAPWPFAVVSLALNVIAAHGSLASMLAHGIITASLYTGIITGEIAMRRLGMTDTQWAYAKEAACARAHARDRLRWKAGLAWRARWRKVPALLRRQLRRHGTLPAHVTAAIRAGALDPDRGHAAWMPAVNALIDDALARRDPKPEQQKPDPKQDPKPKPEGRRRIPAAEREGRINDALRILDTDQDIPLQDVAAKVGVPKTVLYNDQRIRERRNLGKAA